MPIPTPTCETLSDVPKPADPEREKHDALLAAAVRARKQADEQAERKRLALAEAIVAAYRTGRYKAAQIAKQVDYTPEHVRRLLRAAGIEGDPTRLTPAQRAAQAGPETETGRQ